MRTQRLAIRPGLAPRTAVSLAALLLVLSAGVRANPQGGVVVRGEAEITTAPGEVVVHQKSGKTVVNWNGFSVEDGEVTRFKQPDRHSIALNRVVGKDASRIDGRLKADGHVWLVNRNGVTVGPKGRVDATGFLATTADIDDDDFMAGNYRFARPSPNPDARVVNQGTLSLADQGLGALVAPHARNDGVIEGRMAKVVIGGAETFTLDLYGDGLIQFDATSKVKQRPAGVSALAENSGEIRADGGTVLITAEAAAGIVEDAINMSGKVQARSFAATPGRILLRGGDEGLVRVSGTLDASGVEPGATGGRVDIRGKRVLVEGGARIDAAGPAGGGEVLIGGDQSGRGPGPNAQDTVVMPGARIAADAQDAGKGGRVIVYADKTAKVHGNLSARGGPRGGDGGFVETSGKASLEVGTAPQVGAAAGVGGTWLIDPADLTVSADQSHGVELTAGDPRTIAPNALGAVLRAASLSGILVQGIHVILNTIGTPDTGHGDIVFAADVDGGAAARLTVQAAGGVRFNANLTVGSLSVSADGGDITEAGQGSIITYGAAGFGAHQHSILLDTAVNSFDGGVSLNTTGGGDARLLTGGHLSLAAGAIGGNLVVQAADGFIGQSGALSVRGSARFIADVGSIDLPDSDNSFVGPVRLLTPGTARLHTIGSVTLDSSVVGDLEVAAPFVQTQSLGVSGVAVFNGDVMFGPSSVGVLLVGGSAFQTGPLVVDGTAVFNGSVFLTDAGNGFLGEVILGGGPATLVSGTPLRIGGVASELDLTSPSIVNNGSLSVSGTAAFTADQIDLSHENNDFAGAVTLNVAGGANLFNDRALQLGPVNVGGELGLTVWGAITSGVDLSVGGAASFITRSDPGAPISITIGSQSGSITARSLTTAGTAPSGGDIVIAEAAAMDIAALETSGSVTLQAGTFSRLENIDAAVTNLRLTATAAGVVLPALTLNGWLTVGAQGSITQTGALTVGGTAAFDAGDGSIVLTDTGNAISGAVALSTIGTGGADVFNRVAIELSSVQVGGDLSVTADGDISLPAVSGAQAVTLNSTGITTLGGAITDVTSLSTDAGGSTRLGGNVTTSGNGPISFGDALVLIADVTLASGSGTLTLGGRVDATTAGAQGLTLNSAGITILPGAMVLASLTTDSGGATRLGGSVTTQGPITIGDTLTLTGDGALDTTNQASAAGADIRLNGVTTDGGAWGLTLSAGGGSLRLDGSIGSTGSPLGALAITSAQDLRVQAITAASLTQSAGTGITTLNGDIRTSGPGGLDLQATRLVFELARIDTQGGPISLAGAMTLSHDLAIDAGAGGITIGRSGSGDSLAGAHALTLTAGGDITLDAAIGQGAGAPLAAFTIGNAAAVTINEDLTTSGTIAIISDGPLDITVAQRSPADPVTRVESLGGDITLSATRTVLRDSATPTAAWLQADTTGSQRITITGALTIENHDQSLDPQIRANGIVLQGGDLYLGSNSGPQPTYSDSTMDQLLVGNALTLDASGKIVIQRANPDFPIGSGTADLSLIAGTTINDNDQGVALRTTGTLTLSAGGAIGGNGDGLTLDVARLVVTDTKGHGVTVTNAGTLGNGLYEVTLDPVGPASGTITIVQQTRDLIIGSGGLNAGSGGRIVLRADAGALTDGHPGTTPDLTADSLALTAATGIGNASHPIATRVAKLDAETIAGGIFIAESDDLQLGDQASIRTLQAGQAIVVNSGGRLALARPLTSAGGAVTLRGGAAAPVTIDGTITSNGGAIALSADGLLSVRAGVQSAGGNVDLVGGRVALGAGITSMGGGIGIHAPLDLTADVTLDSVGTSTDGAITLGGTLDAAAPAASLTLRARTGALALHGAVGATNPLGILTLESGAGATLDGLDVAGLGVRAATLALGQDLTGTVAITGSLALTSGLTVGAGGYDIALNGAANSIAGATTFNNRGVLILGDSALDRLTVSGGLVATAPSRIVLGGTIQTTNQSLTLGDADTPVELSANLMLSSGSADLTLGGAVDAVVAGAAGLTLNSGGVTALRGAVGAARALGSLATDAGGGAGEGIVLAADVTSTGDITFGDTLSLSQATRLVSSGGAISAAAVTDGQPLTLVAGRDITLDGIDNDLSSVSITSGGNVALRNSNAIDLGAATIAGTLSVNAAGPITQTGPLWVGGAADFRSAAAPVLDQADNDFGGVVTLTGATGPGELIDRNALTLGTSTLGGSFKARTLTGDLSVVGAVAASGGLQLQAAGGLVLNAPVSASDALSLQAAGRLDLNSVVSGAGVVGLGGGSGIGLGPASLVTAESTLTASAPGGDIVMADGARWQSGGPVLVDAGGSVYLGRIDAGLNPVTVSATGGVIADTSAGEGAGQENLVGGSLSLYATVGIGSPGAGGIDIVAASLDAATPGSLYVAASGALQLGNRAEVLPGGSLEVSAAGPLAVARTTAVRGGGDLILTTTGGDIRIGADLATETGNLELIAGGSIVRAAAAVLGNTIDGLGTLSLCAVGSIGSATAPILLDAAVVAARSSGPDGGIYLTQVDGIQGNLTIGTTPCACASPGLSTNNGDIVVVTLAQGQAPDYGRLDVLVPVTVQGQGDIWLETKGSESDIGVAVQPTTGNGTVTILPGRRPVVPPDVPGEVPIGPPAAPGEVPAAPGEVAAAPGGVVFAPVSVASSPGAVRRDVPGVPRGFSLPGNFVTTNWIGLLLQWNALGIAASDELPQFAQLVAADAYAVPDFGDLDESQSEYMSGGNPDLWGPPVGSDTDAQRRREDGSAAPAGDTP